MSKLNGMLMIGSAGANVGKTTAAARLTQRACAEGFTVTGLLAPSVYLNGELMGFDALDLKNKTRARR